MDYRFLEINLRVDKLQNQLKWDISEDVIESQAKDIMAGIDKTELLRQNNEIVYFYLFAQSAMNANQDKHLMEIMLLLNKLDGFLKGAFKIGDYSSFSSGYIEKIFAILSINSANRAMDFFDVFDEIKSKELFLKNPKLLINLRAIFIKNGDIELFLNGNLANAIRSYKSADIYEYCFGHDGPLISLNSDEWTEIMTWHFFVEGFRPDLLAKSMYLMTQSKDMDIAITAFEFRKQVDFTLDYNGRIWQGCYLAYYAQYSVTVLATLTSNHELCSKAVALFELNRGISYREVFNVLDEKDEKEKRDFLCRTARVLTYVSDIKGLLKVKTLNEDPIYYTSLKTLFYMLPDACRDDLSKCGKLSIMHVSYMNDPTEGRVLYKRLGKEKLSDTIIRGRIITNMAYVFMKCFTNQMDYLPMWEIYGDHAEGCCIVLDKEQFIGQESDLFRVCYLDADNSVTRVNNPAFTKEEINYLEDSLINLKECANTFEENEMDVLRVCLADIRHLFKESSYSYEHEMRIIKTFDMKNDAFQHTKSDDPIKKSPLLYVRSDKPVHIKEIVLGPKFSEISCRVPYLQEQIEEMSNLTNNKMPIITKSSIHYR